MKTILVIAAHPDDEVLGLGGTLRKHVEDGYNVQPIIFADGDQVRYGRGQHEALRQSCIASCGELGIEEPIFVGLRDQQLDTYMQLELTQIIEEKVAEYEPNKVYIHHSGDINKDHQVLSEAALVACRSKPGSRINSILSYYVPSSTDWAPWVANRAFLPNWFEDISGTIERKLSALSNYESEIPPYPHPRSIKAITAQAQYWGNMVGVPYAEPFELLRAIVPK